ncbi:GntR family transcriptional regulator [Acuticoccus sediminis]|nr:GntR family transcriptional regulator [Acuticoccus sediminis]
MGDLRIAPRLLVDEVVNRIRDLIATGALRPGDRIVETDLSARFGVSRPLLREAIRTLQAQRLCVITPHRGAHIPVLGWDDAREIYHVRELLEGEACALCAAAVTDNDVAELEGALARFGAAVEADAPSGRIEATEEFYEIIVRTAGNSVLEELLQGLIARVSMLRARSMERPGRARHSYVEMKAICEAIARRDGAAAREAAIDHVRHAREAAKASFAAAGGRDPAGRGSEGGETGLG